MRSPWPWWATWAVLGALWGEEAKKRQKWAGGDQKSEKAKAEKSLAENLQEAIQEPSRAWDEVGEELGVSGPSTASGIGATSRTRTCSGGCSRMTSGRRRLKRRR